MQLKSQSLPTNSREAFCLALKTARERKKITLDEIAEATKIPASLFAALERNDLRHWPHGLFRRSFFRDYAGMIGLPVAETCAEFVRLFLDGEGAEVTTAAPPATEVDDVRLVFDAAWHGPRTSLLSRLIAASIDAAVVILVATVIVWGAGIGWPAAIAIVGLSYFSLATALLGKSPASWAISCGRSLLGGPLQGLAAVSTAWRHLSGTGSAADSGEEPEMQAWVSDARRVGPAPSPRFRARIKLRQ